MALHLPRQASRHFANFIALRLLQSLSDEFIERKRFRLEKWMETDNGSPIPTHTHISRIDERVVYKAIRERELIWRGVVVNSPKIHLKKKEMRFVCSAFANGKNCFHSLCVQWKSVQMFRICAFASDCIQITCTRKWCLQNCVCICRVSHA